MKRELFNAEEQFMARAIELAKLGMESVSPNPMVGCVIVHEGIIIGEGYHREYGKAHAEVNAVNSVKNKELLRHSALYVTLEPCSHHGKTPPCTDLILQHGIPNVIVGTVDPFEKVAGRGIEKLRAGGCKVEYSTLEDQCKTLNKRFFTFHREKRPYVILKWAQTADGFIDIDRSDEQYGQPTWITNDLARIAVHKMRSDESAILVGTNTAQKDNPSLTVRDWNGKSPLRLLLDKNRRLETDLELFNQIVPTVVYTSRECSSKHNLEFKQIEYDGSELNQILNNLYERGVLSLIVEGGQSLLNSFIDCNLWDEARVFTGKCNFYYGVKAPVIHGIQVKSEELDDSWMFVFQNGQNKAKF